MNLLNLVVLKPKLIIEMTFENQNTQDIIQAEIFEEDCKTLLPKPAKPVNFRVQSMHNCSNGKQIVNAVLL